MLQIIHGVQLTWVLLVSSILLMVLISISGSRATAVENAFIRVRLHMFLQILGTLEVLATKRATMGLERDMDADVRGDVVALHHLCATGAPRTCQAEVVSTLAANVFFT